MRNIVNNVAHLLNGVAFDVLHSRSFLDLNRDEDVGLRAAALDQGKQSIGRGLSQHVGILLDCCQGMLTVMGNEDPVISDQFYFFGDLDLSVSQSNQCTVSPPVAAGKDTVKNISFSPQIGDCVAG